MRRTWKLLAGAGIIALVALLVWQSSFTGAQNVPNGAGNGGKDKAVENPLPIRQVVLFNSGVGYMQREGEVSGDSRIELTFPASDINDLLKSLVLQDLGGGRISTVNYDSYDPIDKILRSFALDLNNNPTFGQILNQARGEKIEITRMEKAGQTSKVQGTIVGMETRRKTLDKGGFVDEEFLNLTGPNGLQAVALEQVLGVKFLNPTLDNEFQRALQVLARSHDVQKKTVSLGFSGAGKRAVRVGYVVERPIWKTTYRLRMEPNGKLFLQGWALVENTSDDDWNDVRMVLVSGKPISYQMNLYEPLYIPRPFVEPELFASLRPPVYSGAMDQPGAPGAPAQAGDKGVKAPQEALKQLQQQQMINPNFMMPMQQWGAMPMPYGGYGQFGQFGQFGQMGLVPGNTANPYQNLGNTQNFFGNTMNKLTYEELQNRRKQQQQEQKDAKKAGSMIAGLNFKEGIQSVATAEEIGDYYQYILDQKITLPRQKSAMMPILDQTIDGAKVSIYNESTHAKYPLLGLRLKNTSGQPLTQGPITVYENSTYAGDTRILDLQPNEERLLSYALDQSTEIKSTVKVTPSPDMNFKIGEAQLTARYKLRQTKTYTIRNRSTHHRTVILEHPIRTDWKLLDPVKPSEKSRDHYRFTVTVAAGKTENFDVVEEQARLDTVALTTGGTPTPFYAIASGIEVKPAIHREEPKLVGLRIQKGFLVPTWKTRESKTYFVQNLSEQDREFTVDHIVRPDWTLLDADGDKKGPSVFRFTLKVAKGKTGEREVREERVHADKGRLVKEFSESKLREFLANAAVSAEVKAALTKVLTAQGKIEQASKQLAETNKHLDDLSKDQARLRENLKIIPMNSEHYKKFLEKFVGQETQIEALQMRIRELSASLEAQRQELDAYLAKLDAE